MNELADAVGLNAKSISLFEMGKRTPAPESLQKLAAFLGFDVAFFLRPIVDLATKEKVSFRALTSMSGRDRDAALASAALVLDISTCLDRLFELPEVDLPDLHGSPPDVAADALRREWGLGDEPLPNVVHLVEARGVRVFSLPRETAREVNAFATWMDGRPFIFLTTSKSPERSRFDVAHELGHLVLHRREEPHGPKVEAEANAFAAAFLMPKSAIKEEAPRHFMLDDVLPLKAEWRVSVASYVKRLHSVGAISDWQYRDGFIEMGARGWRTSEPRPKMPAHEVSRVLENARDLLRAERAVRDLVDGSGLSVRELNDHAFDLLPELHAGDGLSLSPPRASLQVIQGGRDDRGEEHRARPGPKLVRT